jgi:iron complex outermembrane receptor protein
MSIGLKNRLLLSTIICGAVVGGSVPTTAVAAWQDVVQEPAVRDPSEAVDETGGDIVVTGSRIARPNLEANSPIAVVSGEDVVEQADITIEQYLNTLPQINAAGTTTSNNPPNGGQANIDLRGLGANRNLVLIDGRRPMVSASSQTVDLNTIPQGLIERIEVITGGAGATYGADAIAGVANIRMKNDFEGIDLRATYANTIPETDSREYQISGVIGGNFEDGRGNIAFAAEYSNREELGKFQRAFASQATSTTPTPPTGRYIDGNNAPSQAAINALFGSYGSAAKDIPVAGGGLMAFNSDGSLFGTGTFNSPRDVTNFRYAPNDPNAAPNQNYFPDFYSYNFDFTNVLVLPLERKSAFLKGNYEVDPSFDVFVQGGYTEYQSASGSAATPLGTAIENATCGTDPLRAQSELVNCFREGTTTRATVTGLVVPITNPFIPADLRALLATRTGNDSSLAGSGATEPIRLAYRFLPTGLRRSEFDTQVIQGLVGARGDISDSWRYEAYYSWGRTRIDTTLTGGVNVQNVQQLLESPTGGTDLCEGGFNPFGIQPLSEDCIAFVDERAETRTEFTQRIAQAFVTGELAQLPAGAASLVVGVESRKFDYVYDSGSLFGPIAGPNTGVPSNGTNSFFDIFGEVLVPIVEGQSWAESLELNLTVRHSSAEFKDILNDADGDSSDWTYGATLSWQPIDPVRIRASYQRAVRAPNFGELFSGGSSFPQYFDPCSVGADFRTRGGAAAAALCQATGVTAVDSYVQTPGSQVFTVIAGNTDLRPEKADTWTLGAVFQALGFTGSIDYYNIAISDTIQQPNPNAIIAACYGYHGANEALSATSPYCQAITGNRGPDISQLVIPEAIGGNGSGAFLSINTGKVKTSGLDFQLGYNLPTPFAGEETALRFNLLANYLIDYKSEDLPGVMFDYSDTVAFFGAGLGQTFPRWKAVLNAEWDFGQISFDTRVRFIDAMKNRASVIFPGETSFTGVPSVWYFDFALQADIENMTFRIGLNNAFDKQPPLYAPNVQSGTDPSVYDILGRRAYVSARLKF